ncbi:MAG: tRNA pseudouridine(38-40) synthase TruA, partial [Armatimonadota bacterium]
MPNIKAVIEYDGADFHGFQIQPNTRTVQHTLEKTLSGLLKVETRIVGAGRTDAGVHATRQVISFRVDNGFPPENLCIALNGILPGDVKIKSTEIADDNFNARYSAKSRTYVYAILNRQQPSVYLSRYTWHVRQHLDTEMMKDAASRLIGSHDFSSFGTPDHSGCSTIRQLSCLSVWRRKDAVFLRIRANAFLRGMARAMTGVLVEV